MHNNLVVSQLEYVPTFQEKKQGSWRTTKINTGMDYPNQRIVEEQQQRSAAAAAAASAASRTNNQQRRDSTGGQQQRQNRGPGTGVPPCYTSSYNT